MLIQEINYNDVGPISKKDNAYINSDSHLKNFLKYPFDYKYFAKVLANRNDFESDRPLLHSVVKDQYKGLPSSEITENNIQLLKSENTFTVTTAHQPSLLTGPLYYIYKILSTVNLSYQLKKDYPAYNFVPVFVSGGEDHDFEEINHFHLYQKKIEWQSDQRGSVGKFKTDGLKDVLKLTNDILGEGSNAQPFITQLEEIIGSCDNYGQFSFRLTHLLFDHLGLVILMMDDARLKRKFIPIIKREILNQESKPLVTSTQESLEKYGFSPQAHCRDINVFYRHNGLRNRIEKQDESYIIVDTELNFTEEELITELENHPERFSPNVILRPLFQELILPNLAYIGGGGEIAYWFERLSQFEHFKIPFPMLVRRTSAMIISNNQIKQIKKLGLTIQDLFMEKEELINHYLEISDSPDYSLQSYKEQINKIYEAMSEKIKEIDKSVVSTTKSESVKSQKSIDYLESKLKKSVKQKQEVQLNRITKLKNRLFPSGLQERHDNIFEYISTYGISIIDKMLPHCNPFDKKFKVFLMTEEQVQES